MVKLYRSRKDRIIFGVCGGLARYFDVDPTIIRLIFIVATIYHGSGILLYILLAIIIPEKPKTDEDVSEKDSEVSVDIDRHSFENVDERKKLFALGLIVVGFYLLIREFVSFFISSSQILGILLVLLGLALILRRGRENE
jgi:phage shock protein C